MPEAVVPRVRMAAMRLTSSLAAIGLCASVLSPVSSQNWPQFRGPRGDGAVTDARHPEQWSPEEHVAWKTAVPGVGWSQPVVWGDKLFVTTAVSDNQQRPKPGDWTPGDSLGGLGALFGSSFRKPPSNEYRW